METRIIHTKIWDDQWFFNLSVEAQRLFLFILTCREINICGIFEIPDSKIKYYMKFDDGVLKKAKEELSTKVKFSNSWVAVKNVDKYNCYAGPKNEVARENQLKIAPKTLIQYVRGIDTSIDTSIDRKPLTEETDTSMDTHLNHNQNPNHNLNQNEGYKKLKAEVNKIRGGGGK